MSNDQPTAPIRPLVPRRQRPVVTEDYRPTLLTEVVSKELKEAIDSLRRERAANDERAESARARNHMIDVRYYFAKSDGLSSGIATLRDALFHLTGEEY